MSSNRNLLAFYPVVKRQDICPPAKRRKLVENVDDDVISPTETLTTSWTKDWTSDSTSTASLAPLSGLKRKALSATLSSRRRISPSQPSDIDKISDNVSDGQSKEKDKQPKVVGHLNSVASQNEVCDKQSASSTTKPTDLSGSAQTQKMNLVNQLAKGGKIQELKETLTKLKNAKNKLKTLDATTSASKQDVSSSTSGTPAYQRFHALTTSDANSQLLLPYKYKFLAEVFLNTDTVAGIMHNRKEICYFNKLKSAVQELMRRTIDLKHLAQIKSVYSSSYVFSMEKVQTCLSTSETQLAVSINTDCLNEEEMLNDNETTSRHNRLGKFVSVDPKLLVHRRKIFRDKLLKIVKTHHMEFLSKLSPPIKLHPDEVLRWHPQFPLEDLPDIPLASLPESESSPKCMSARDVLNKIKGLYCSKLDKALENVANIGEANMTEKLSNVSESSKSSDVNPKLKGIPSHLIAKIRAKEAEKTKADMRRNPVAEKEKVMFSRLPEIARILRNYFISERKAAVSIGVAVNKILESYVGSLTLSEMESHVLHLTELAPDWLTCVKVKSGLFLKMNKQTDFKSILDIITEANNMIP